MPIERLSQHLGAYLVAEGKAEAEEKVVDWLYYLYELATAGQNVSEIICDIEAACAANKLDFIKLKLVAKRELAAGQRETKQLTTA